MRSPLDIMRTAGPGTPFAQVCAGRAQACAGHFGFCDMHHNEKGLLDDDLFVFLVRNLSVTTIMKELLGLSRHGEYE